MKTDLNERLNDIISEKEEHISKLENKIDKLKENLDYHRWSWCRHQYIDGDDKLYKDIPYPRLEMFLNRLSENDWSEIEWIYGLVYSHYADAKDGKHLLFIPFSQTSSRGGFGTFETRFRNGKLETPFRDSAHIESESLALNLPAYITCKEKNIIHKVDIRNTEGFLDIVKSMIKK